MSKELEALERLTRIHNHDEFMECYDIIENGLKALEIIKETLSFEKEDFFYEKIYDTYFFIGNKVSKEKYDLLKEVLL